VGKKARCVAVLVALLALALRPGAALARGPQPGAVYLMTNQDRNAVAVFERAPDGTLSPAGTFPTGGSGNPVAEAGDPPFDPLASQGALILSEDDRFLFAVNAGSDEISVLAIRRDRLTLVDKVASGGIRPISLTVHADLLYVLNEGGTPNVTGFIVSDKGRLTPLAGSTRPLTAASAADPAQVGFSPDGELLAVTDKASNLIDTYTVGDDGLASGPRSNASEGPTPFGFAFNRRGHLVVTEIGGALSSYAASEDGALNAVSESVPDFQTAACWVVITRNGRHAFVSNPGSSSVSSYRLGSDGTLTLLDSVAGSVVGGAGEPGHGLDMALDKSGRYLYVHAAGIQAIAAFRVGRDDGSLTPVGITGGLPFAAQGIAAR
jgi:6-phosphogluconolactonase (cycloisomerase 2 family)